MQKKYDMAVKTGEYTLSDGTRKSRYENIGAVMQGDNGPFIMLKRTFNAAGVPNPDNRDSVLVSLFQPRQQQQPAPQHSTQTQGGPVDDFDDSVPFAPVDWRLS